MFNKQILQHLGASKSYIIQAYKVNQWLNLVRFDDLVAAKRYFLIHGDDSNYDALQLVEESKSRITGITTSCTLMESKDGAILPIEKHQLTKIIGGEDTKKSIKLSNGDEQRLDPQISIWNDDKKTDTKQPALWSEDELLSEQLTHRGVLKRNTITGKGQKPNILSHEIEPTKKAKQAKIRPDQSHKNSSDKTKSKQKASYAERNLPLELNDRLRVVDQPKDTQKTNAHDKQDQMSFYRYKKNDNILLLNDPDLSATSSPISDKKT
ncbi:MAG: hypothetical protein AAF403_07100, partial [Pseudomonadota bacterium]